MVTKKVFKATPTIADRIAVGIEPIIDDKQNQIDEIKDELDGGITSDNMSEYRNTYVFNNHGVLDSTHDMIMDFELIDEMTKLVECKVSFKVENFVSGVKDV